MFNLFRKAFVATLNLLHLNCLIRLRSILLISLKYKMELNCKKNSKPSITKLIDCAQMQVMIVPHCT